MRKNASRTSDGRQSRLLRFLRVEHSHIHRRIDGLRNHRQGDDADTPYRANVSPILWNIEIAPGKNSISSPTTQIPADPTENIISNLTRETIPRRLTRSPMSSRVHLDHAAAKTNSPSRSGVAAVYRSNRRSLALAHQERRTQASSRAGSEQQRCRISASQQNAVVLAHTHA